MSNFKSMAKTAFDVMQRKPECNDHTWLPQKPYTPEFMVKELHIPQKETDLNHKCVESLKDSLGESMGIEAKYLKDQLEVRKLLAENSVYGSMKGK